MVLLAVVLLRTAWLYSRHGTNFVNTMVEMLASQDEVRVVADQVGTPTWARGLAKAVWAAVRVPEMQGIHHWTDGGVASWYDFAIAIQEEAAAAGLPTTRARVIPSRTGDAPRPAPRPSYSVLDQSATRDALGLDPVHWRIQLRSMLREVAEVPDG